MEYRFLVESTMTENATFPCKTVQSKNKQNKEYNMDLSQGLGFFLELLYFFENLIRVQKPPINSSFNASRANTHILTFRKQVRLVEQVILIILNLHTCSFLMDDIYGAPFQKNLITLLSTKYFFWHHFLFVDMKYYFCATSTFFVDMKRFFVQYELLFVDTKLLFVQHQTFCFDIKLFSVQHQIFALDLFGIYYCYAARKI